MMKRFGKLEADGSIRILEAIYEALMGAQDDDPPDPPIPDPDEGDRALEGAVVTSNSADDIWEWDVVLDLEGVYVTPGRIVFPFSGPEMPIYNPEDDNPIVGNLWFGAKLGGDWHFGTVDWLRPHQSDKRLDVPGTHRNTAEALPTFIKSGPLGVYVPSRGDECAILVSSVARNGLHSIDIRSDVILFAWPY
jgi:hypothetical protein